MVDGGRSEVRNEILPPPCFVLMPITDPEGYVKGHFKHVCDDIIAPACEKAGFKALRADQVKQSNLIHLDVLQKLLEAPMAICDLSSRNPNVLFELALRQAFEKPVALVQEVGTPAVFDISPFRYVEYRRERTYHEVLEDQKSIAAAIKRNLRCAPSRKRRKLDRKAPCVEQACGSSSDQCARGFSRHTAVDPCGSWST